MKPDRPKSQNQFRPNSPKSKIQKNRPTFVMGHDEDSNNDTALTHTTGRFRVTKQSPSCSTVSQETESLIKKPETKF